MITLTMNKEDKNMKEERTAKEWIKEHKTEQDRTDLWWNRYCGSCRNTVWNKEP